MLTDSDDDFADADALLRGTVGRLRAQGGPAMVSGDGGFCYYRADPSESSHTPDRGCAVGVWLPDIEEVQLMSGDITAPYGPHGVTVWNKVLDLEPRLSPHRGVMLELQRLHDTYSPTGDGDWNTYLDLWADAGWRGRRVMEKW